MKVDLLNSGGKAAVKIDLNEKIFGGEVNGDLLAQAVRVHLANLRQGSAATKGRGAVRGGGRKPWKQKGTGRARQGSVRSPIWVGGGVAHGPHPKDWSLKLPAKMKRRALLSSLADKAKANRIFVVKNFPAGWTKTKDLNQALNGWQLARGALLILGKKELFLGRLGRNLPDLAIGTPDTINAFRILSARALLLSREGLREMEDFLLKECQ